MKVLVQVAVVPILIALYIGAGFPLLLRQFLHVVVCIMDWAFERIAVGVGYNPSFWPLPSPADEDLPLQRNGFPYPPGTGKKLFWEFLSWGGWSVGLVAVPVIISSVAWQMTH